MACLRNESAADLRIVASVGANKPLDGDAGKFTNRNETDGHRS